jgi:hypothetical protein
MLTVNHNSTSLVQEFEWQKKLWPAENEKR